MATTDQYLTFSINLTDAALVATLQGTPFGGVVGAILAAPDTAAVTYSAPVAGVHDPFEAPSITSSWFGGDFPTNVADFTRCSGGWFGVCWLFGDKIRYHWRGIFTYVPPPDGPGGPAAPPNILPRRWVDGFEFPANGEGSGTGSQHVSRLASRHVQGFGFAIRPGATTIKLHVPNAQIGGPNPTTSWERFYVRPVTLPTGTVDFWQSEMSGGNAGEGYVLALTPTGQIAAFRSGGSATKFAALLGTTPALVLNTWVRIDVLLRFGSVLTFPNLRIFVNGVEKLTLVVSGGNVNGGAALHNQSQVGPSVGDYTMAMDVDDWMCADYPGPVETAQGPDWNSGSAMLVVSPTGFDPSTTDWTGDWRTALQNPNIGATMTLSTAVAAARLAMTTDAEDSIDAVPGSIGIAAMVVALQSPVITAGSTLGYKFGAAAEVLTASLLANSGWYTAFFRVTGQPLAQTPNAPLLLIHVHGAAGASTVTTLGAVAEVLGVFGPEDVPVGADAGVAPPPHLGQHNAPYPRTPWATLTKPPIQPVVVVGGSYVGTGTFLDLAFSVPVHFLWIRPVTGNTGGTKWWSTLLGPHQAAIMGPKAHLMVQAGIDGAFVPGVPGETPAAGDQVGVVHQVKAALVAAGVSILGDCGAFEITKRVAWTLRAQGIGLRQKLVGVNCDGYSTDVIDVNGQEYDIIGNAGTTNDPQWLLIGPIDPANVTPAIDPGDDEPGGTGTQQGQTLLRLIGTDTQNNAVGVTYVYLAIGDPGQRFMLNAGLADPTGAVDKPTTLLHPTFTPQAGFFWPEPISISATDTLHYKGPGHAAASMSPIALAEVANYLTFAEALLTSQSAFHTAIGSTSKMNVPFNLWRTDDGSGHAGKVVQLMSYVGDGAASRSIALTPASGKRPLFAMVMPHNAAALMRDHAHTTVTSSTVAGAANASTGITGGGIDTLLVGSVLNTNAIVYDVFVIPGSDIAGNGGFSIPGTFYPVPPEPPPDAPAPEEPEPPEVEPPPVVPVEPVPGIPLDCIGATTLVCNIALSHLGISQPMVNVSTDLTPEATLCRLHYSQELEAVLRAFPWPFATKYATPVWVAGSDAVPVNDDWTFAYRAPADMLFARRFVTAGGKKRAYDPAPITFRVGRDTTGPLLYSDVAIADARLEYTIRLDCPASQGDALFRSAFAWRMAHALAPGLSRDEKKVAFCWAMYERQIATAQVVAANESQQDPPQGDPPWIAGRD